MPNPGVQQGRPKTKFKRAEVLSVHRPFHLTDSDFLRLTKIPGFLPIWAHTITAGSAIYILNLFAEWASSKVEKVSSPVTTADWIFVIFLVLIILVLQVLNWRLPSEKKNTERRIAKHFEEQDAQSVVMDENV